MQKLLYSQRGKAIGYFAIFLFLSITIKAIIEQQLKNNDIIFLNRFTFYLSRLSFLYSLQKRFLFLPCFHFYRHIKHSAFLFRRRHCIFLIHDIPDKGRFRFRHSCHALYDHCRRIGRKPSDHSHRRRHILRPHILCRFHSRNCILHILRFRAHHI